MNKKIIIDKDFLFNKVKWTKRHIREPDEDEIMSGTYKDHKVMIIVDKGLRGDYQLYIDNDYINGLYSVPQKELKFCWKEVEARFEKKRHQEKEKNRAKYDMKLKQ